jgi:hypothetical protein
MYKKIKKLMPKIYFKTINKEDFNDHEIYINKVLETENHNKTFNQKSDTKEYFICNYNLKKLKNKILKVVSDIKNDIFLYRIFPNKENNFILTCFYENLETNNKDKITIHESNDLKKIFIDRR